MSDFGFEPINLIGDNGDGGDDVEKKSIGDLCVHIGFLGADNAFGSGKSM